MLHRGTERNETKRLLAIRAALWATRQRGSAPLRFEGVRENEIIFRSFAGSGSSGKGWRYVVDRGLASSERLEGLAAVVDRGFGQLPRGLPYVRLPVRETYCTATKVNIVATVVRFARERAIDQLLLRAVWDGAG